MKGLVAQGERTSLVDSSKYEGSSSNDEDEEMARFVCQFGKLWRRKDVAQKEENFIKKKKINATSVVAKNILLSSILTMMKKREQKIQGNKMVLGRRRRDMHIVWMGF